MAIRVEHGDCLDVLAGLPADSVHACVTDPPYHLTSIVKRFGKEGSAPCKFGTDGAYARASRGFMGKVWDGGDIALRPDVWCEVFRVLKPGAHLLAFGGTRTYHRMTCAIEDAGFEVRDCVQWLYGSGFPKSHNVAVAIAKKINPQWETGQPLPPEAEPWNGYGTAFKPACELIAVARKPLSEKTVAANVLRWGTGAINVDGCRVKYASDDDKAAAAAAAAAQRACRDQNVNRLVLGRFENGPASLGPYLADQDKGRWPSNVLHDGSEEVLEAFAKFGETRCGHWADASYGFGCDRKYSGRGRDATDSGTAARFFYCAKASKADRCGSKHPTVKPIDLIAYLCRLITPPGGTVIDPFAGSGTTGAACIREGFNCILIEKEAEYVEDIKRRLKHIRGDDMPMFEVAS